MKWIYFVIGTACAAMAPCASAFQTGAGSGFGFAFAPDPQDAPRVFSFGTALTGGSFLGVGVAEIDNARAKDLKLREEQGVEITRIEDDSPAAKAGLKVGDVVLEYNGQRVEGMEQFGRLVRETPVGREVKLLINRNGAPQTVQATVGSRKGHELPGPNGTWHFEMPEVRIPDMPTGDAPQFFSVWRGSMLGVETESLNKQLGDFFGVKEGVLVRTVVKGSAAEMAGIRAGDVITKVDQNAVTTPNELSSAIRSARSKKSFAVQLVREKREMSVNVTIEDDRSNHDRMLRGRSVKM